MKRLRNFSISALLFIALPVALFSVRRHKRIQSWCFGVKYPNVRAIPSASASIKGGCLTPEHSKRFLSYSESLSSHQPTWKSASGEEL